MRVLLDENLPHQLQTDLVGHQISTVTEMGWSGTLDDMLLGLAAANSFAVLLTCDRNLPYQQPIDGAGIAILVLAVPNNRLATIRSLVPEILAALSVPVQPGSVTMLGSWRVS